MTREEILAMKPGSELDVLVAEKTLRFPAPAYSSDIRAAWELVEHLHQNGRGVYIHYNADNAEPASIRGAAVMIYSPTDNAMAERTTGWIHGESVPHALCLAAILAVEAVPMG